MDHKIGIVCAESLVDIVKACHESLNILYEISSELFIQLCFEILKLMIHDLCLGVHQDHPFMDQLCLFLLVGDFFHDGNSGTSSAYIVVPCYESAGEDNPISAGFDCCPNGSITSVKHVEGHGGNGNHSIHRAIGKRDHISPIDALQPIVLCYYEKIGEETHCIDEIVPFDLPEGWIWARGFTCFLGMESKRPIGSEFDYIDIDSVDNRAHAITKPKRLSVQEAPSRASRAVQRGSVLFSLVRPYLQNIALVPVEYRDCIASTGFYICNSSGLLLPEYMYYMMLSP